MPKFLQVQMEDGSLWEVPADFIIRDRVSFYAKIDKFAEGSDEWKEEWEYTSSDDYEIEDWAASNMNWADVRHLAVKLPTPPREIDFQQGWINGPKKVVEHD